VLAVVLIGRWHGLRSLLGLGLSLMIVIVFVVPAILAGQSPPLVALVGAVAVMIVTLYLAHGVNEMTTAAIVGTTGALVLTVGLGLWFIDRSKITGYASDDALFASFAVQGLDLQGLVLAGLIIAALGVLDDVTVSQASTVFALHDTDRTLTWSALFARAMRVGRDHIASVVNTLFLAYAGASLALLVLFSTGGVGTAEIVNSEIIAEEIVKIIVGSLGLIAAVPLTTALAARVAVDRPSDAPRLARATATGTAGPDLTLGCQRRAGGGVWGRHRAGPIRPRRPTPTPEGFDPTASPWGWTASTSRSNVGIARGRTRGRGSRDVRATPRTTHRPDGGRRYPYHARPCPDRDRESHGPAERGTVAASAPRQGSSAPRGPTEPREADP
jgi:hypothetical protein